MKLFYLIVILQGCSTFSEKDNHKDQNRFELFYKDLPSCDFPIHFSQKEPDLTGSVNVLNFRYSKSFVPANCELGLSKFELNNTKDLAIIYFSKADEFAPLIMIYDEVGRPIDSFWVFDLPSSGVDYELFSEVTVHSNEKITKKDSVCYYDTDPEGAYRFDSTERCFVSVENYISETGSYFVKVGRNKKD